MKIGICIPCHYGHIGYLDCVLASIDRQTVAPHIVSISISDFPEDTTKPSYISDKYEIRITTSSNNKNAAENRNIAAWAIIDQVDILSFIDADDFAASTRNEVIQSVFLNTNADLFLHNYLLWTSELQNKHVKESLALLNLKNIENIPLSKNFKTRIEKYTNFGQIYISDNSFNFHNAHVSIKSNCFKKQQFPEDEIIHACEDSHFNYLHYMLGSDIVATPLQLSLYAVNNEETTVSKAIKEAAKHLI
jgi:hypothetical protein